MRSEREREREWRLAGNAAYELYINYLSARYVSALRCSLGVGVDPPFAVASGVSHDSLSLSLSLSRCLSLSHSLQLSVCVRGTAVHLSGVCQTGLRPFVCFNTL